MTIPARSLLAALLALPPAALVTAQTVWDFGADPDRNWSAFANWSTDASPAGTAVVFGATGTTANATTVSNIVDQDHTINALTYNHTANWHVTEIGAGRTLTVNGSFLVGGQNGNSSLQTRTAFTGAGALVINDNAATFSVTNTNTAGSGGLPAAVLDLSNLETFTATVNTFTYGSGTNGVGQIYLADNTTITASTLTSGGAGNFNTWNNSITNRLYLGTTTVLNVDTIAFATGRTQGLVSFRPADSGAANTAAVTSPTLTIRGATGGTSRAALSVGNTTEGGIYNPSGHRVSTVDFSGGSVDALVSTLLVGRGQRGLNGTASYTGRMILSAGTFDAISVIVGEQAGNTGDGNAAATMIGNLQITGGDFTAGSVLLANLTGNVNNSLSGILDISGTANVHITGDLTLARRGNTSNASTISATANILGGLVTIDGNLVEGANANANPISSTVNLSGGVLDVAGNVTVDTFNQTGGTLRNVAALTVGTFAYAGGVFDNVAATTINDGFSAVLNADFTALAFTGTLTLGSGANLGLTLADGFAPVAGFTLIDGFDSIAGTFATINGDAFGAGNTLTLTNNLGSYDFTLLYNGGDLVLSLVPEPSAWALFAGLAAFASLGRRRRG